MSIYTKTKKEREREEGRERNISLKDAVSCLDYMASVVDK